MKKTLVIILFISFTSTVFSQKMKKEYYEDGTSLKSIGKADKDGNRIGKWVFYDRNGKLLRKGKYVNNKKNGKWKFYYENGNRMGFTHYKHGEFTGKRKSYYDTGVIKLSEKLNKGHTVGKRKHYDKNGKRVIKKKIRKIENIHEGW